MLLTPIRMQVPFVAVQIGLVLVQVGSVVGQILAIGSDVCVAPCAPGRACLVTFRFVFRQLTNGFTQRRYEEPKTLGG